MIFGIITFAIIITMFDFVTLFVYGWFVPKKIREEFMNISDSQLRLNQFNRSILSIDPHISKVGFSFCAKYYISDFGTVLRWSRLHKRIEEYYAIAIRNSLKPL